MLEIKICIKNIGVQHSLEKNETATMFFLKKPSLVKLASPALGSFTNDVFFREKLSRLV